MNYFLSIFSIFAFATCGGFQGETTLLVSCKGVVNKTVTAVFAYPFRLNTVVFSAPDPKRCGGTWTDVYLVGNFSSSAQFFVTLAVLVFLYCIAALVVYVGYKHVYQQNSKFPLTDLAITVITAFLWLVSTFAWAKALADIKMSTGASIIPGIESCKAPGTTCRFASVTSMGTLNVSVVLGLRCWIFICRTVKLPFSTPLPRKVQTLGLSPRATHCSGSTKHPEDCSKQVAGNLLAWPRCYTVFSFG
ncbi:synaptophysin-like protein 1 isoform X1 [Aptenodytes patagonicus]|uniref:synaptophysin-like protein 1 isoform X1 n=1 Tax=Aptenodytes patagonicus TaxID=9234 RepID=UPI003F9F3163